MSLTTIKAAIVGIVVVGAAAIFMLLQHQTQIKAHEENQALRQQIEQLNAENERLSTRVAKASADSPSGASEQERELLRLRAEVGNLRKQVAEAAKLQERKVPQAAPAEQPSLTVEELQRQAGFAKMNYLKGWMTAFYKYAQQNQDQFPEKLELAEPFLPPEFKSESNIAPDGSRAGFGLTPDRFEIMFQGSIKSLPTPQTVIVLREKEPWQASDGSWLRAYGFADGHSEIHKAADGNFATWEAQHGASAVTAPPGQ
jgi:hypothetical protein